MPHRRKNPKPRTADAIVVDRDPPPSAPAAAVIVLRQPGESRDESLARVRREIAAKTGRTRGTDPAPWASVARSHDATSLLRSWLRSGAEVVWAEADGSVSAGRWSAGPDVATSILAADGTLSRTALRLVSSWLASTREAA